MEDLEPRDSWRALVDLSEAQIQHFDHHFLQVTIGQERERIEPVAEVVVVDSVPKLV